MPTYIHMYVNCAEEKVNFHQYLDAIELILHVNIFNLDLLHDSHGARDCVCVHALDGRLESSSRARFRLLVQLASIFIPNYIRTIEITISIAAKRSRDANGLRPTLLELLYSLVHILRETMSLITLEADQLISSATFRNIYIHSAV